ncbi:YycH family regulatory protein [Limosilactobacillus sp.]|uniref:YycH family regulatory protein n=1 Tax=Limosilactobacillus sp. TaxID=2773925 RepID=UPI003F029F1A
MIKKLRTNWLAIALALAVILSLFLSSLIWTNPFQYEGARRENIRGNQQYTTQSMGDVYLPTTVVRTDRRGNQTTLYSPEVTLVREMRDSIRSWQFGRVSAVKTNNSDVYLSYLRHRNSLMLSYPNAVPTLIFNETFSQEINSDQVGQINHIVIPLSGPREVYLLSDHHYGIYRLRVNKGSFSKIVQLAKGTKQIPVDHKIVNGQTITTYPREFTLPTFAFQITNQNIETLSSNLISGSRQSNITTTRNGDRTIYTSGNNRRLSYNRVVGTINYRSYASDEYRSTEQLYSYFYNRLVKTGVQLNNIRFDGTSAHDRRFTYRTFIDGFPVFNDDGYGSITMTDKNGAEQCQMSRYSLQVPLPTSQRQEKLPSSTTVFNLLHASPHFKEFKGLRIGYLWKSGGNKKVVKLTPTYFVKYHGNWVDYEEFVK